MKKDMLDIFNQFTNNCNGKLNLYDFINFYNAVDFPVEMKAEYVDDNFDFLLDSFALLYFSDFLDFIFLDTSLDYLIIKKKDSIIEKLCSGNTKEKYFSYFEDFILLKYFSFLSKSSYSLELVIESLRELFKYNMNFVKLYILDNNLLGFKCSSLKYFKNLIQDYSNENLALVIENMVIDDYIKSFSFGNSNFDINTIDAVYKDFFITIVKELLEETNTNFVDIKKKLKGSYSNVYKIGDKILKIGIPRQMFQIPNNKYIIQPLFRLELKSNKGVFACVEVMEEVDVFGINDDDLDKLSKIFDKHNLVCSDLSHRNIGRLKKDNCCYLNNEKFMPNGPFNGFDNEKVKILKKDNLVLIDTDYVKKKK